MSFRKLLKINEDIANTANTIENVNSTIAALSPDSLKAVDPNNPNDPNVKAIAKTATASMKSKNIRDVNEKDVDDTVKKAISSKKEINSQDSSKAAIEDAKKTAASLPNGEIKDGLNSVLQMLEHSINKEYAKQRRITEDQINKKCSAAVLFIDLDTLKVLGVHSTNEWPRRMHRDDGDWQLPKGEIEYGENPVMTAIREMNEELGVDITPIVENGLLHHFGVVPYIQTKDLDLYWISVKESTLVHMAETCSCKSYFTNRNGIEQPEVDDYKVCSIYELTEATQRALSSFVATIMS